MRCAGVDRPCTRCAPGYRVVLGEAIAHRLNAKTNLLCRQVRVLPVDIFICLMRCLWDIVLRRRLLSRPVKYLLGRAPAKAAKRRRLRKQDHRGEHEKSRTKRCRQCDPECGRMQARRASVDHLFGDAMPDDTAGRPFKPLHHFASPALSRDGQKATGAFNEG